MSLKNRMKVLKSILARRVVFVNSVLMIGAGSAWVPKNVQAGMAQRLGDKSIYGWTRINWQVSRPLKAQLYEIRPPDARDFNPK